MQDNVMQSRPPRGRKTSLVDAPRIATIHEYLDWTVTAEESVCDNELVGSLFKKHKIQACNHVNAPDAHYNGKQCGALVVSCTCLCASLCILDSEAKNGLYTVQLGSDIVRGNAVDVVREGSTSVAGPALLCRQQQQQMNGGLRV